MSKKVHLVLILLLVTVPAAADTVYLEANFDDKPIDSPIGTGGPDLGEPVEVFPGVTAIVRGAPMASPSLEIQDIDDYMGDSVNFEFLGSAEITTGKVGISAMLWFTDLAPGCDFSIFVREQGSASKSFANILFLSDGTAQAGDANGPYHGLGTYETGRVTPFGIIFDMDLGTYDIWLDGVRVLEDETHGITDRGVGSVRFGCLHDSDLEGCFLVDDILVANYLPAAEVEPAAWGQVKALYR
jgi:hypothetical protein